MNQVQLEQLLAFEDAWDGRLGGVQTRGLREVICYCAARLKTVAGVEVEEVLEYLRQAVQLGLDIERATRGGPQ